MSDKKQQTNVMVYNLEVYESGTPPLRIVPREGDRYSDSYNVICTKPLHIQKDKQLILNGNFTISVQQPVDHIDDTNIVLSPYHIGWKVEPNMELFIAKNIMAYGTSGSMYDTEFKMVLFNMGPGIFSTVANDIVATIQFYLVPKLQLKRFTIS